MNNYPNYSGQVPQQQNNQSQIRNPNLNQLNFDKASLAPPHQSQRLVSNEMLLQQQNIHYGQNNQQQFNYSPVGYQHQSNMNYGQQSHLGMQQINAQPQLYNGMSQHPPFNGNYSMGVVQPGFYGQQQTPFQPNILSNNSVLALNQNQGPINQMQNGIPDGLITYKYPQSQEQSLLEPQVSQLRHHQRQRQPEQVPMGIQNVSSQQNLMQNNTDQRQQFQHPYYISPSGKNGEPTQYNQEQLIKQNANNQVLISNVPQQQYHAFGQKQDINRVKQPETKGKSSQQLIQQQDLSQNESINSNQANQIRQDNSQVLLNGKVEDFKNNIGKSNSVQNVKKDTQQTLGNVRNSGLFSERKININEEALAGNEKQSMQYYVQVNERGVNGIPLNEDGKADEDTIFVKFPINQVKQPMIGKQNKVKERQLKVIKDQPLNIQCARKIIELGKAYKSEYFKDVAEKLEQDGFTHMRGIRGDGNCYYRAVAYGYIEKLYLKEQANALNDLCVWIMSQEGYFKFSEPERIENLCQILQELIQSIAQRDDIHMKYALLQKIFVMEDAFDKNLIYMIRYITKNFIEQNKDRSINGLPISATHVVEQELNLESIEQYIEQVVIKMERDAQGVLLNMVPIAMRINIFIVNIDTSLEARKDPKLPRFVISEFRAYQEDIRVKVQGDNLNFHDETIYVLRKDGHYDLIYRDLNKAEKDENKQKLWIDIEPLRNADNEFQEFIDKVRQDQEEEKKSNNNVFYLTCCKNEVDKQMLVLANSLNYPDGQIFQYENDVIKVMLCEQGHRMMQEDLIKLYPDQEDLIRTKYAEFNKQNERPKILSANIKPVIEISPAKKIITCKFPECGREILGDQNMFDLDCGCQFHELELYLYFQNEKQNQSKNNPKGNGKCNFVYRCPGAFNEKCSQSPPKPISMIKMTELTLIAQQKYKVPENCRLCDKIIEISENLIDKKEIELNCQCVFHAMCLYNYVDESTRGNFNLEEDATKHEKLRCPYWQKIIDLPNASLISEDKIVEVINKAHGGDKFQDLWQNANMKKIRLYCCRPKEYKEVDVKNKLKEQMILREDKTFQIYTNSSGPLCLCKNQFYEQDITRLLGLSIEEVRQQRNCFNIRTETGFDCCECLCGVLKNKRGSQFIENLMKNCEEFNQNLKSRYKVIYERGKRQILFNNKRPYHELIGKCNHDKKYDERIYGCIYKINKMYAFQIQDNIKDQEKLIKDRYQCKELSNSNRDSIVEGYNLACRICENLVSKKEDWKPCENYCLLCVNCINRSEYCNCGAKLMNLKDRPKCFLSCENTNLESSQQLISIFDGLQEGQQEVNMCAVCVHDWLARIRKTKDISLLTYSGIIQTFKPSDQNCTGFGFPQNIMVVHHTKFKDAQHYMQKHLPEKLYPKNMVNNLLKQVNGIVQKQNHCKQINNQDVQESHKDAIQFFDTIRRVQYYCLDCGLEPETSEQKMKRNPKIFRKLDEIKMAQQQKLETEQNQNNYKNDQEIIDIAPSVYEASHRSFKKQNVNCSNPFRDKNNQKTQIEQSEIYNRPQSHSYTLDADKS